MLFIFVLLTPMLVGYDLATKGLVSGPERFLSQACMALAVAILAAPIFPEG